MKMVKSLLLGTAAGFVAVAAAQAADLESDKAPPKADYVKVCNLYGEGFYQIPGEGDICIRIGATARLDGGSTRTETAARSSAAARIHATIASTPESFLFQGRGTVWLDARQMTQYGVLKAYFSGGFDASTGTSTTGSAFWKRGYIGFAGATVGKTQSFFDFLNGAFSYGSYHLGGGSNTYDTGTLLAAYTAEFGLGISATLSIEDSGTRRNALWDAGTNALSLGNFPGPNGTNVIWFHDLQQPACDAGHGARVWPANVSRLPDRRLCGEPDSRTWSPTCGSIRAGARRRSPALSTRFAPAPTATTSLRFPRISVPPNSPDKLRRTSGASR